MTHQHQSPKEPVAPQSAAPEPEVQRPANGDFLDQQQSVHRQIADARFAAQREAQRAAHGEFKRPSLSDYYNADSLAAAKKAHIDNVRQIAESPGALKSWKNIPGRALDEAKRAIVNQE